MLTTLYSMSKYIDYDALQQNMKTGIISLF